MVPARVAAPMSFEYKDYYLILGVARFATETEIRQSFRKLAQRYHPDVATSKAIGEQRFKEINEAYEVLSDPERRREYDALGPAWKKKQSAATRRSSSSSGDYEFHFRGTGFSDFFQNLLGSMARRFRKYPLLPGRWIKDRNRGRDIEADVLVTLEEAIHGSKRKITVERTDVKGKQIDSFVYEVRIPPGIVQNQIIRLGGQGEPGKKNGAPGDLLLHVHYAKHPDFEAKKSDIYFDVEIAPWEAVLGCQVTVRTLEGETLIKVPSGTQNGQRFRLKGQGLPMREGGRGDLFAAIYLQVPPHISSRERAYWEQLARNSKFKARD